MSATPDDLDVLLGDIHKTIHDNRRFLQALADDADNGQEQDDEDDGGEREDFEEL
ncbi:hypothetical protein [Oryzomonas rubra]|uniref:hypothetical protein n=1 Tax=Oryzomonas rubra TaxID=2509454 RepID=UPI00165EAE84|nr:hypothetical protein [Oryzomonas rubra]